MPANGGLSRWIGGFAVPSIVGALKRRFRDSTRAMRVPRPIQELALRVPVAADEFGQRRGSTPTSAEHLNVAVDEVLNRRRCLADLSAACRASVFVVCGHVAWLVSRPTSNRSGCGQRTSCTQPAFSMSQMSRAEGSS